MTATVVDPATGAGGGKIEWDYSVKNSDVQYLDSTESRQETFNVTVNDGHGGTDSELVTVTIFGADDPVTLSGIDLETPEVSVNEKNLSGGSDPQAALLTKTGSFSFTAVDGLASITVGGVAVAVGATVDTALGLLTITGYTTTTDINGEISGGTVTYEYVLQDNSLAHNLAGTDSKISRFLRRRRHGHRFYRCKRLYRRQRRG